MMIPKTIHYCWFGREEMPELAKKSIESWRRYCPDYKIVQWNEENYDIKSSIDYVKEAYQNKAWSFVSDYVRLDIIYNNGGIYLDTDVELIKSLDSMLEQECFLAMETSGYIATGLGFGAIKKSKAVEMMMDEYEGVHYVLANNIFDKTPCPTRNTRPFINVGFKERYEVQSLDMCNVYPPEYFCPLDYETKDYNLTKNTISIHHYNESWITEDEKRLRREVDEYSKMHGRFSLFLFKNKREFELTCSKKNIISFFKYVLYKVKKKILQKRVRN